MAKTIVLAEHLSVQELEENYRQAKTGIASRQFQALWLLAQGNPTQKVSQITGYSRHWLYCLIRRYNQLGLEGVGDRRRNNHGTNNLLSDVEQAQLWQVLQGEAPGGGLWNGAKVAQWLSQLKGEPIHRQRGWEILRQMTFRLRVPRPAHQVTTPEEQEAWKKNSSVTPHN